MKFKLLLLILLLTSCKSSNIDNTTKLKFCIHDCVVWTFSKAFHARGRSWGTSSSSMVGLTQTEIYNKVNSECKLLYQNESCCRRIGFGKYIVIRGFGRNFGLCGSER